MPNVNAHDPSNFTDWTALAIRLIGFYWYFFGYSV